MRTTRVGITTVTSWNPKSGFLFLAAASLLAMSSPVEGAGGGIISRPRVAELKQMLSEFTTGHLKIVAKELKATGGGHMAESLTEVRHPRTLGFPRNRPWHQHGKYHSLSSSCHSSEMAQAIDLLASSIERLAILLCSCCDASEQLKLRHPCHACIHVCHEADYPATAFVQAHKYLGMKDGGSAEELRGKAEAVRAECWEKLSSGGGWPNQGWREAYVFSLMLASMHIIDACSSGAAAGGQIGDAMRHLDMALIMGAPGQIVLPMVDTIEPSLKKECPAATEEDQAYMIADAPPSTSPSVDETRAIKRVDKIPFAEFKKTFFKTDSPVVITVGFEHTFDEGKKPSVDCLPRFLARLLPR